MSWNLKLTYLSSLSPRRLGYRNDAFLSNSDPGRVGFFLRPDTQGKENDNCEGNGFFHIA